MPLPASQTTPLDERPGAVNFALAVWVGLVAAVILSLGGFDAADPLRNAWTRLVTLGVTAGALALAFHVPSEWLARRLQLGVAVSLILHTLAAIGLANVSLQTAADPLAEPEQPPLADPLPAPVLAFAPTEQAPERQQFELPVETAELDASVARPSPERRTVDNLDVPEAPTLAAESTEIDQLDYAPEDVPAEEATPEVQAATYERSRLDPEEPELVAYDAPEIDTQPNETDPGQTLTQPMVTRPREPSSVVPQPIVDVSPFELEQVSNDPPAPEIVSSVATPTPVVEASAQEPRASVGRSSGPPLVSVAPLQLEAPASDQPSTADRLSAATTRPRSTLDARPARTMVESIATLAAPAPSPLDPVNAGEGPTSIGQAPAEQTVPLPGRQPQVTPQGRRPRRVAQVSGVPAPSTLATPIGPFEPATSSAAQAGEAAPKLGPNIVTGRSRRQRAATAPPVAAELTPVLPPDIDLEIGPGASTVPPTTRPSSAEPSPRIARASRPRRQPIATFGAPAGAAASLPAERKPAPAFAARQERQQQPPDAPEGGTPPRTEAAIELGLQFLVSTQREDGSWSFLDSVEVDGRAATARADGAATGLALLSLLGAGCDHFDSRHGDSVRKALDYLIANQRDDGLLFPELGKRPDSTPDNEQVWQVARFYSHGVAAIALCEAFGMTGDAMLREPAQRALDYIQQTQTPRRGGWRYTPAVNADLSVTGWQLMALRSGELAGLKVAPETYENVRQFVESCRERSGQRVRFCYNPNAAPNDPRTSHGRRPGTVMTAVGLLSMLYLGDDPRAARMQLGANHLLAHLPTDQPEKDGPRVARISTIGNPLRDTYYWYYATQVMYHMSGKYWQAWNDALHPVLVDAQVQQGELAGSWDPHRPLPDRWSHFGGRHYVTTMNLLSLEVYYRHLPLYGRVGE